MLDAPVLAWSSYLGSSIQDSVNGVAIDGTGKAWVVGSQVDPFLSASAKLWNLNGDGTLGGQTIFSQPGFGYGTAVATDAANNVWVAGSDDPWGAGESGVFVSKFNAGGTLVWRRSVPGPTVARGIAVDEFGSAWITGNTNLSGWTVGGFDTTYGGGIDGFVAKLDGDGTLVWSSYLGGSSRDIGNHIALDDAGNAWVTGETRSNGWAINGFDTSHNGNDDAFVAKINTNGNLAWSSYLGGINGEAGSGIATDSAGNAFVVGDTESPSWASGGFDTSHNGENDGFLAKVNSTGTLAWSSYIGGTDDDLAAAVAVDDSDDVWITGQTLSTGWAGGTYAGGYDAFLAMVNAAGAFTWSTYLGGVNPDGGTAVATDSEGDILVAGDTGSPGWISGGFDTTYNGDGDGFVAKFFHRVLPSIPDLDATSDTGASSSDNITLDQTPTFTGTSAEPESAVSIFAGAVEVGQGVASGGLYSITTSALAEGVHLIRVRETVAGGDMIWSPSSLQVTVDLTAPTIGNPGNQSFEIVNTAGTNVSYATATASDNFTTSPVVEHSPAPGSSFLPGDTPISVTATDLAGNASNASFDVSLVDAPFIVRGAGAAYAFTGAPGAQTLTISAGLVTFIADAAGYRPNLSVSLGGAGANLVISASQHLAALDVGAGTAAALAANGARILVTESLSLSGSGTLDLNDNDLVLDYSGPSQFDAVRSLINSARGPSATWDGPGITSSSARDAASQNTTLGVMESVDYLALYSSSATFNDQPLDSTMVLVKYTYYGDTDFSGAVDFDDYVWTDAGFNLGESNWRFGDFDGNGAVDFDDYVLIDLAFNTQGALL